MKVTPNPDGTPNCTLTTKEHKSLLDAFAVADQLAYHHRNDGGRNVEHAASVAAILTSPHQTAAVAAACLTKLAEHFHPANPNLAVVTTATPPAPDAEEGE